jgi:hypothetical protein
MATGINATNANAKKQFTYFETRAYIGFPSTIKLNDQVKSCLLALMLARTVGA